MKNSLLGTSKNSNFFMRARKRRAENRSVYGIHEDSSTKLTRLSWKKCIFRGALLLIVEGLIPRSLLRGFLFETANILSDLIRLKKQSEITQVSEPKINF